MKTLLEIRVGQRFKLPKKKTVYVKVTHDTPGIYSPLDEMGYCCIVRLSREGNPVGTSELEMETEVIPVGR